MWVRQPRQLFSVDDLKKYGLLARYLTASAVIASVIYYVPNYSWLEAATAYHSALVMSFFGIPAIVKVTANAVVLNGFLVEKACTGIQVVAIFVGTLLPLPRVPVTKKALGLAVVTIGVYLANILRIVVQLWVYDARIFDWTTIHGPGGIFLGAISVALLVILLDRFVPEFGDLIFSIYKH